MSEQYERLSDSEVKFYANCGGYYPPDSDLKAMALEITDLRAAVQRARERMETKHRAQYGSECSRGILASLAILDAELGTGAPDTALRGEGGGDGD